MKVAWLMPVLGVDGQLLYLEPLLNAFAAQFGDFRVFTARFDGDAMRVQFSVQTCGRFMRLYRNERSQTIGRPSYIAGFSLMGPSILWKLASYRPDLLVLNEFGLLSLYGVLYRKFSRRRIPILLLMEAVPRWPDPAWLRRGRLILRRLLVRSADAILTNNAEGEAYLTEVLQARKDIVIRAPYLVSRMPETEVPRNLKPADKIQPRRGVRFLYVGQLIERKGLEHALKACAALLPKYKDRFVYEIVGDGPQRSDLEKLSRALGLGDHVLFRGRQPYADLARFYFDADVFLFPTLADYRSLAPFEALSFGLPILASIHDGGISETVREGRNGFSFEPRDTIALSSLMASFLNDPSMIDRFASESIQMAKGYDLTSAVASLSRGCDVALRGSNQPERGHQ